MKDRKQLQLKEINDGKKFVMPIPTVRSYEKYMAQLSEFEEKLDEEEFLKESNKIMLVSLLQEVDDTVNLETINNMHPMDFQILMGECAKVYDEGGQIKDDDKKNE
jgi:hypothetical protein